MIAPRTDPPPWDADDDGDHSAFTHRDDDEPSPYRPSPRTDPQSTVPVEPLSQLELDAVRIDLDPDDAYQYGGWAHLVARLLATLDALPVREDEPTGIDVERLVRAMNAIDNHAYGLWEGDADKIAAEYDRLTREASHVR